MYSRDKGRGNSREGGGARLPQAVVRVRARGRERRGVLLKGLFEVHSDHLGAAVRIQVTYISSGCTQGVYKSHI